MADPSLIDSQVDKQNLSLAAEPPIIFEANDVIYTPIQSFSVMGFFIDDIQFSEGKNTTSYGFQINYMFPQNISPHWELGASISQKSASGFYISKRWIINERSSFRPFYKWGGFINFANQKNLAVFTQYKNYYLSGSLGIEDLLKHPMSIRIELQALIGAQSAMAYFLFGYSWGE